MSEFHDVLDEEIEQSMSDPEYAAAWIEDLTPEQRRTLSVMSRVDLNSGIYAGWVDQRMERLHKNSLYALERRGFVEYDRYRGVARIRTPFVGMATACREAWEAS